MKIFFIFIVKIAGFYFITISMVFNIDNWSLLKQTIVHFILMSVVYFPVSVYAGWIPVPTVAKIIFIIFYVLISIIVWLSFKAYWKKKAMEINKQLELRNKQTK
ncbi:DUF3021 domain-containing protein [Tissierella sp. MSJ-40]|uniref:DUF3021 domain-containing protein n=1 Tax=Tissierella simiarum TaxID=2841534 RepID=A0ABS6E545_9FIRM|nr:DUF3021 domain-containing protein [Tissierella simiarum]MBU5438037.1 DUF3021 domain-containing protein [Tissierella simiarum]